MARIVHVVGTGTIGEPLIGLFTDFADKFEIDEVTFHKRTPLASDRARVNHLMGRGARLVTEPESVKAFEGMGHEVSFEAQEALERATVVIDCTPAGNDNKRNLYSKVSGPTGFLAQGSEFGFGKPYARGINEDAFDAEDDRFVQIVSCNTHNIATLVKTITYDGVDKGYCLDRGTFVCMRRANDITQVSSFLPAPAVGKHGDEEFGTHHARDAFHLYETLDQRFDLFSSAVKLNTQYMHSIWFHLTLNRETTVEEVVERLHANHRVAVTDKLNSNLIFSFGRDHGYYGRILSQTVVVVPSLTVRHGREVIGFCFTPQDGNSLVSSVAAALWRMNRDWEDVGRKLQTLRRWLFQEI
jgi:glyceraldehyde-3-phosphate dehydrogenase/erythrose-4-phosphate dehydrogenase